MSQTSTWELGAATHIQLDVSGKIVDYVDTLKTRPNTPEERVRQYYARVLVEEYQYPKNRVALEAPIKIGSETRSADIVIYNSVEACKKRDQGRIFLIVETKAPAKQDGQGQLKSYIAASSATGGVWTNGNEAAYFRQLPTTNQELKEWTNIPRFGETWDTVGHYKKQQLQPPKDLKQVFQRCHNAIYKAGLDSEDIAIDMVRIILAKYRDEQNPGDLCNFRCTPNEFESYAGRREVAVRIHDLFSQVVKDFPDVFPPNERITIGPDNLAVVVNELQPYKFLADHEVEQVYDVIGTAFEVYVSAHLKGNRGQYFTNRLVVNMMVKILDPSEQDVIFDPSCGPGGFLVSCLRHVRSKILDSTRTPAAKARELRSLSERLYGIDISPKLVRVAKTNMILNGDGHGGLVQGNTLRDLTELPISFPLQPSAAYKLQATKIFSNPPFGASSELRERSSDVLSNFELGRIFVVDDNGWTKPSHSLNEKQGVPPEVLFLERCIDMLAPGGRLAIVIARGVLDNRDTLAARQYILTNTTILGIINCHPNTFAPFNGTKASILILQKKATPGFHKNEDYPIFMAISQRVGQDSQGRDIYKRDANGNLVIKDGQTVLDHDLDEIAEAWLNTVSGNEIRYEAAWTTKLSTVISSIDMRMNPVRYAPEAETALANVLELADTKDWIVERLGDFATIFNGPRFKRPFADDGVNEGPNIVKMYTPKAFFEERGESAKYLDLGKASTTQLKQLDALYLEQDWILIVDSGTSGKLLGRVGITTATHVRHIANNNMIRVVIDDPKLRDYTYQFLRSDLGQALVSRNVYGTNQDHIEPDDIKDIPIPIPRDKHRLEAISNRIRRINFLREEAAKLDNLATTELDQMLSSALVNSNPKEEL